MSLSEELEEAELEIMAAEALAEIEEMEGKA